MCIPPGALPAFIPLPPPVPPRFNAPPLLLHVAGRRAGQEGSGEPRREQRSPAAGGGSPAGPCGGGAEGVWVWVWCVFFFWGGGTPGLGVQAGAEQAPQSRHAGQLSNVAACVVVAHAQMATRGMLRSQAPPHSMPLLPCSLSCHRLWTKLPHKLRLPGAARPSCCKARMAAQALRRQQARARRRRSTTLKRCSCGCLSAAKG